MPLDAVATPFDPVLAPFDAVAVSFDDDFLPFDAVNEAFFGMGVRELENVSRIGTSSAKGERRCGQLL